MISVFHMWILAACMFDAERPCLTVCRQGWRNRLGTGVSLRTIELSLQLSSGTPVFAETCRRSNFGLSHARRRHHFFPFQTRYGRLPARNAGLRSEERRVESKCRCDNSLSDEN